MKITGPNYITKHFYTKRYKTAFKLMQISKKPLQNVSFMADLLLVNVQVYKPVRNGLTLATISWEACTAQRAFPESPVSAVLRRPVNAPMDRLRCRRERH